MFVGRETELAQLKRLVEKTNASLGVIKGRRRIGKTRLITEFAKPYQAYFFMGLAPDKGIDAKTQRLEFVQGIKQQFGLTGLDADDWSAIFKLLARLCSSGRVILVFDEISWMAHGDPSFLPKLKNAWDLEFSANNELILLLCGSVSSWIDKNILSSSAFLGRPSLVMTIGELPLHDCNKFWPNNHIAAFEKLKILAITGGVPRYLEQINSNKSAESNIAELFFNPNGPLINEFRHIFSDIYGKRNEKYLDIINCLVQSSLSREEIIINAKLSSGGDVSEYLKDLEMGGFVRKSNSWDLRTSKASIISYYSLQDNYSRFYLKYIYPNYDKITKGLYIETSINQLPGWNSILGLQFENLVLNNHTKIIEYLGLQSTEILNFGPYQQRKTARHAGCQIDYLLQTKHDVLYLCEIKFSRNPVSMSVITEVQQKIQILAKPKSMSVRAVLIHVSGVSQQVLDADFFSDVIDFGNFLED